MLTLYRNAKCVIANRLHCVLPCLAQETPVVLVKAKTDDIRFAPYYDFLHWVTVKDFLEGNYDYDFLNPPENKPDYKEVREKLVVSCSNFVKRMEDETYPTNSKFTYTDAEIKQWQYELMDLTLHKWVNMMRERDTERKSMQIESKNKQL